MELTRKEYIGLWLTGRTAPIGTFKRDLQVGEIFTITQTVNDDGLPVLESDAIEFNNA